MMRRPGLGGVWVAIGLCLLLAVTGGIVAGQEAGTETNVNVTTPDETAETTENSNQTTETTETPASISDGVDRDGETNLTHQTETSSPQGQASGETGPSDRSTASSSVEARATGSEHGSTIVVGKYGRTDFQTIQGGIAAASDGDRVVVRPGTYNVSTGHTLANVTENVTVTAPAGATIVLGTHDVDRYPPNRGEVGFRVGTDTPLEVTLDGFDIKTVNPYANDKWQELDVPHRIVQITEPRTTVRIENLVGSEGAQIAVEDEDASIHIRDERIPSTTFRGDGKVVLENVTAVPHNETGIGRVGIVGGAGTYEVSNSRLKIDHTFGHPTVSVLDSSISVNEVAGKSGSWVLQNVTAVGDNQPLIDAEYTNSDWHIEQASVSKSEAWAIEATGNDGEWAITNSTLNGGKGGVVEADVTGGDWTVRNSTFRSTDADMALQAWGADGDWTIENTEIEAPSTWAAVRITRASGDWRFVETSISNGSIGLLGQDSTADVVVRDSSLTNATVGINASESAGEWTVEESTIRNVDLGVDGVGADGNWRFTGVNVTGVDREGIRVVQTSGAWVINQSRFRNVTGFGVNATDVEEDVDASQNWWGARSGPGGFYTGSGSGASSSVSVKPFYVDDQLTTLREDVAFALRLQLREPRNVTVNDATISGPIQVPNDTQATVRADYWVEGQKNETIRSTEQTISESGSYEFEVDLRAGTEYRVKVHALSPDDHATTRTRTISTPGTTYDVVTGPARIDDDGAVIQGEVTGMGAARSVTPVIEYWRVDRSNESRKWTGERRYVRETFTADLTLQPNTTYRYRALARDDRGEIRTGKIQSLTTAPEGSGE